MQREKEKKVSRRVQPIKNLELEQEQYRQLKRESKDLTNFTKEVTMDNRDLEETKT
jgi:hypothetical protein